MYDEEEAHGPDHYHPGELKLLDGGGGEFTEKELRSNVPQRTQPELFEWTCCGALGNEQGCQEKGRLWLRPVFPRGHQGEVPAASGVEETPSRR